MKRKSAELKRWAREAMIGKWGLVIGAGALSTLITLAVLMPFYMMYLSNPENVGMSIMCFLAAFMVGVISMVLQCGLFKIHLGIARRQEVNIAMLFHEFVNRPDRYIVGYLLLMLLSAVCIAPGYICLLVGIAQEQMVAMIIGGVLLIAGMVALIVLSLRYALIFLLLTDQGQIKVGEAYHESARLMKGNQGRFFYISLSFIGWKFLGMLSWGIGMLWIIPYQTQTTISFYQELLGELDTKTID